jgi:hypothetical protein
MELALNLVLRLKNVLPVTVMAKYVYSKASSPCSKLALSAAAQVNTYLSLAKTCHGSGKHKEQKNP